MNGFCFRIGGALLLLAALGCQEKGSVAETPVAKQAPAITNRIDIPGPVRSNLGITFAKVERRAVASTIRVPGQFELIPTARVEHRTPLRGRVELLAQQFQSVRKGDVLYRLDSPDWRELQRELSETITAIDVAEAQLKAIGPIMEAHRLHEIGLQQSVELWEARVKKLEELGTLLGGQARELAEVQAKLTDARSALGEVMEKDAELKLRQAETESRQRSATAKLELLYTSTAALLAIPRDQVTAATGDPSHLLPYWQTVTQIDVRASLDGTVEQLAVANGAWAEVGALVVSVIDPTQVRFRAMGLQSDLERLRPGLPAAIINPAARGAQERDSIPTELELGLAADPAERTIELLGRPSRLESWTRAGVSAYLEIATASAESAELAIPLSSVVRDGLTRVIFRRDPANPDKAIRIDADLGLDDGRWVVIHSGVREGDEVVLDGVYQLLLATSGSIPQGGHFHADGTFHEGPD